MLLFAYVINAFLCSSVVLIHYITFVLLTRFINFMSMKPRHNVIISVYVSIAAHVLEVWVFGVAYFFLLKLDGFGSFDGAFTNTLLDCVYFSFVSYTSLGLGDISPQGMLRFTTGLETLTGLVLISWTASFVYYEMQKHWTIYR